ncbi:MAG TPA: TolC family protein [Rhodocyclaceae bacterium]|jgi:cobalt-zinc-cadmium efflux system outer membrane protein|nr:TolC family protein [Rhodocyclaceae bacterium]
MRTVAQKKLCLAWLVLILTGASHAQGNDNLSLKQAFDAAWARQPEARAAETRRNAADARRDAAGNWLAAQPTLGLSDKSDRFKNNDGRREYVVGVDLPLWLPGERSNTQALAEAEGEAINSRLLAAQLRVAARVREAYWNAARARVEQEVVQARLKLAERLAGDVARRVKSGDLSRADQHQADGAAASAAAALAETQSSVAQTTQVLRALLGGAPHSVPEQPASETIPSVTVASAKHPALREVEDRAELARRNKALASVQNRANPLLTVATTRDRDSSVDAYGQTVTVALRIPFGADNRQRARIVNAEADAIEAETQLELDREALLGSIDAARAYVDASRTQLAAAERRAVLARETRGFFDKSFRLGESDLPTRLRIELEAYEAERQLAQTRIVLAQAISQLRQALGLLPE